MTMKVFVSGKCLFFYPNIILVCFLLMSCSGGASRLPGENGGEKGNLEDVFQNAKKAFEGADYQRAQRIGEEGLRLANTTKEKKYEARFKGLLGLILMEFGQYPQAQTYQKDALEIAREVEDQEGLVQALIGLGGVHAKLGHYPQAKKYFDEVVDLAGQLEDREELVNAQIGLGGVFAELGQYSQALAHHQKALMIATELESQKGVANALGGLGVVSFYQGEDRYEEYYKAQDYFERALKVAQDLGLPALKAKFLGNLGLVFQNMRRYGEALENMKKALAIHRKRKARAWELSILNNLGVVARSLKEFEQARAYYEQASVVADEIGEPETLWRVFYGLQETYASLQQVPLAIFYGKQAITIIQEMRGQLKPLENFVQQSFIEEKKFVYEQLADLLIDQGRLWEAQQVLAMFKEEEYFDFIRRRGEADPRDQQAVRNQTERQWHERYQAIREKLLTIGQDYHHLQKKKELTEEEMARLAALEQDLRIARQAFKKYLEDLKAAFAQIGGTAAIAFGEKDLKSLTAFQATLQRLGPDTVLLHFLPMDDQLHIILTTADAAVPPAPRESPIKRADLNKLIFEYREVLQNPGLDPTAKGEALYQVILGPLEKDLQTLKPKTLLVYLDGVMRYLPLVALYDGENFVAERYSVVMYTTAVKAVIEKYPTPSWRVAGLGVSHGGQGFEPLPAVEEELDEIVKDEQNIQDGHGVLPGHTFLNSKFSVQQLQTVLQNDTSPYSVVHVASHFHFRPGSDVDSFLVVGEGKHLTLAELQEGYYPMTHVDLLTLSACDTGIGSGSTLEGRLEGKQADGQEVEGFGVLAQNQGAKAVIATLWSVADRSTGQFMQKFYALRQEKHLTKSEALRRVQEGFIRGEPLTDAEAPDRHRAIGPLGYAGGARPFVPPPGAPYAHPYYWAPFILMGNFL